MATGLGLFLTIRCISSIHGGQTQEVRATQEQLPEQRSKARRENTVLVKRGGELCGEIFGLSGCSLPPFGSSEVAIIWLIRFRRCAPVIPADVVIG